MAEVFAVSPLGMLDEVAGDTGVDATFRRTGCRHRNVFFLPDIFAGRLLAGSDLLLVLSFDGFFCSLAGFSHRLGGVLASMDFPVG
jgi:hypothetical protein